MHIAEAEKTGSSFFSTYMHLGKNIEKVLCFARIASSSLDGSVKSWSRLRGIGAGVRGEEVVNSVGGWVVIMLNVR